MKHWCQQRIQDMEAQNVLGNPETREERFKQACAFPKGPFSKEAQYETVIKPSLKKKEEENARKQRQL